MSKTLSMVLALVGVVSTASAAHALAIEPRAVTWNIVSDSDMSRLCREHGLRSNCEGMAAWDHEFRQCIIWTRSPRAEDDSARWELVHHELRHCQEGRFHD